VFLADPATDDDQIRPEVEGQAMEVLIDPLRPLLPAQVLARAYTIGRFPLRRTSVDLDVAELRVRHETAIGEQG
jgi:hypothetical protein